MNYYKHNIGDFASMTAGMSCELVGVFVRLVDRMMKTENPIKTQWVVLGFDKETQPKAMAILENIFEQTEDGFVLPMLFEQVAEYQQNAEKNRVNGAKGGRPRKEKTQTKPSGLSNETQTVNFKNPSETLTKEPKNQRTKEKKVNQKKLTEATDSVDNVSATATSRQSSSFSSLENCLTRFGQNPVQTTQLSASEIDRDEEEETRKRLNPENDALYAAEPLPKIFTQPVIENAAADEIDPFTPISEQVQAVQDSHALDIAENPAHIVTVPEVIGLARSFGVKLSNTAKLREAVEQNTLTVAMAKKCIGIHKEVSGRPASYLCGIMLNAAKNPDEFNGVKKAPKLSHDTISAAQAWKFAKMLSTIHSFTSCNTKTSAYCTESMDEWVDRWAQKLQTAEGWQRALPTLKKLELVTE